MAGTLKLPTYLRPRSPHGACAYRKTRGKISADHVNGAAMGCVSVCL